MQPNPSEDTPNTEAQASGHQTAVVSPEPSAVQETAWQPPAPVYEAPAETFTTPSTPVSTTPTSVVPLAVVNVLSPRGVEYVFLTLSLFTAAIGLTGILISSINGAFGFSSLSFPVALMLVGLPMFAWLFLRLKKAELLDPTAALDASKRRSTQTTQIICFLVVLFTLIGFVTAIMAKIGGNLGESLVKVIFDVVALLVVFGGILTYYWRDERRG